MVFQKITFDRVFPEVTSVAALFSLYWKKTNFGFESNGKRYFDVAIHGVPKLEKGMTVIALLKNANNWESDSLLGWIDCSTGELFCDSYAKELYRLFICIIFSIILFRNGCYSLGGCGFNEGGFNCEVHNLTRIEKAVSYL